MAIWLCVCTDVQFIVVQTLLKKHQIDQKKMSTVAELVEDVAGLEKKCSSVCDNDLDEHEGKLFLLQLLRASFISFSKLNCDVLNPRFFHAIDSNCKYFADCPDTDYLQTRVSFSKENRYNKYLINCDVFTKHTLYVGIVLYGKNGRFGYSKPIFCSNNSSINIHNNNDTAPQNFKIFVMSKNAAKEDSSLNLKRDKDNTIVILADSDVSSIILRQYYENRKNEKAMKCDIKLIDTRVNKNDRNGDSNGSNNVGSKLAKLMLHNVVNTTISTYNNTMENYKINQLFDVTLDTSNRNYGTPINTYKMAHFKFNNESNGNSNNNNKILKMTLDNIPQKCIYFGVCIYNRWLQSLNYYDYNVVLNHSNLKKCKESDKYIIYVVCNSKENLGLLNDENVNVLETDDHKNGLILFRALYLQESFPNVKIEWVSVAKGETRAKL